MTAPRRRIRSSLSSQQSTPYFHKSSSTSPSSFIERRTIQISTCLLVFTVLTTIVIVLCFMPEGRDLKDVMNLKVHDQHQHQHTHAQQETHDDRFLDRLGHDHDRGHRGMHGHGHGHGHDDEQRRHNEKRNLDLDDIEIRHRRASKEHVHIHTTERHDNHDHRHEHEQKRQEEEVEENDEETKNDNDNGDDASDDDVLSLFPFHKDMDESTKQELYAYVHSIRKPFYESHPSLLGAPNDETNGNTNSQTNQGGNDHSHGNENKNGNENEKKNRSNVLPYDIYNCPDYPPPNYPYEYPLLDIIDNWNPNNTSFPSLKKRPKIYASICRFDFTKGTSDIQKALNYRKAEVPFILRDDPTILQTVKRWNTPNYLSNLLKDSGSQKFKDDNGVTKYKSEYSTSNHLMFFRERGSRHKSKSMEKLLKDWKPPMSEVYLTYDEWVEKASQPLEEMGPDKPHYYFRVNAKSPHHRRGVSGDGGPNMADREEMEESQHVMFKELPFFQSRKNFYIVDKFDTRGINCRFGMNGNIAEAHFDGSRNFIAIFGGERRYVLSHPNQCKNLGLYPSYHPSGRHSALDWSKPDLSAYPMFRNASANEVVLQAGDVLYLPTQWFHFIISLDLNWQCNARSGITQTYQEHITDCGF